MDHPLFPRAQRSHNRSGDVASPANLQLMPIIATGNPGCRAEIGVADTPTADSPFETFSDVLTVAGPVSWMPLKAMTGMPLLGTPVASEFGDIVAPLMLCSPRKRMASMVREYAQLADARMQVQHLVILVDSSH